MGYGIGGALAFLAGLALLYPSRAKKTLAFFSRYKVPIGILVAGAVAGGTLLATGEGWGPLGGSRASLSPQVVNLAPDLAELRPEPGRIGHTYHLTLTEDVFLIDLRGVRVFGDVTISGPEDENKHLKVAKFTGKEWYAQKTNFGGEVNIFTAKKIRGDGVSFYDKASDLEFVSCSPKSPVVVVQKDLNTDEVVIVATEDVCVGEIYFEGWRVVGDIDITDVWVGQFYAQDWWVGEDADTSTKDLVFNAAIGEVDGYDIQEEKIKFP